MQQKMLGDVLTTSILCENLHRHLPGAEVHFLAHRNTTPVLFGNPHVDAVHAYKSDASIRDRLRVVHSIRAIGIDAVIDVYGKPESLLATAALRSPMSIGYRKWYTRPIYAHSVRRVVQSVRGLPLAIEHRLQLLEPLLGALPTGQLATRPRLYVEAAERDAAASLLARHGIDPARPLIMLSVLGSEHRKTYPLPFMAEIIDRVAARTNAQLLFNFLPAQREQAETLYGLCEPSTRQSIVLDAYTEGLRAFIAVLDRCHALIGNEGGAVNMARALQVPSFSIFAPWIPRAVWDLGSDGGLHTGVHLADVRPELVAGRATSDLKARSDELYASLVPAAMTPVLDRFLDATFSRSVT